MNYYDIDKNKYKFNLLNMKYIGEGTCGKVYKYNDNALKIYNDDTSNFIHLKLERFNQFKAITNPHLIRLKNIYTKKVLPFRINKNFITSAYESTNVAHTVSKVLKKYKTLKDYYMDNLK